MLGQFRIFSLTMIRVALTLLLGSSVAWAEDYDEEMEDFFEAPTLAEPLEEDIIVPPEDPEGLRRARPRGRPGRGAPPTASPGQGDEPSFSPPPPSYRPRGTSAPAPSFRGRGVQSSGQVKFKATGTQREYPPRPKSRAAQNSKSE